MNPPLREVMTRCATCDVCRDLMAETSCTFFTELYRLTDREKTTRAEPTDAEQRALLARCNLCGICPCPPIRAWIREAKAVLVEREGLPLRSRVLEDVRLIGRVAGIAPRVVNLVTRSDYLARIAKGVAGIHPTRKLPQVPDTAFDAWAAEQGIDRKPRGAGRKVAYFVGCSARYLFPEVAIATVKLLQHNGIAVYVPPQRCCGTPMVMEGDRPRTVASMGFNLPRLAECVAEGYDIVTACPSCAYMLKSTLREGAEYSATFMARVEALMQSAGGDRRRVYEQLDADGLIATSGRTAETNMRHWQLTLVTWRLFRDEGYFAALNGLERLKVANRSFDLGEYLLALDREGGMARPTREIAARAAYYAPCHTREQHIATPWVGLLNLIPGLRLKSVGDPFDCCGQAGLHGFKKAMHPASVASAARLLPKIDRAMPNYLLTECLSCTLQFNQLRAYRVLHPAQLLLQASRTIQRS